MHSDRKYLAVLCSFILLCVSGCASRNLTGAAKAHQQVTLIIADDCMAAVQAKQLYTDGKLPQTDTVRYAINAAGAACETSKTAFSAVLDAEAAYRTAQANQVNACTPAAGAVAPPNNEACQSASKITNDAKVKVDAASASLDSAMATLASKTTALPKQ